MLHYCPAPLLAGFALLLLAGSAHAQLRINPLATSAIPASLRYQGRVVQALQYTDRTGTYKVLATEMVSSHSTRRWKLHQQFSGSRRIGCGSSTSSKS
jgi:hypothetical protein